MTTSAKRDDGGGALTNCVCGSAENTYVQGGDQNSCYIPTDSPLDRAGNPIYGNFTVSGEMSLATNQQKMACRPSSLNGHPQDYHRTLYNPDLAGTPLGWEERGVELYENLGLSETLFPHPGNYGIIAGALTDVQSYSNTSTGNGDNSGSKCSRGTQTGTGFSEGQCPNRCLLEHGRKISLFGQVGFTYYVAPGLIPGFAGGGLMGASNNPSPGQFMYPNGMTTFETGYGYLINFYRPVNSIPGLYSYYGNSGVVFKDADGKQFYFISGQNPYMLSSGKVKSFPTPAQSSYYLYDATRGALYIDIKYFNPDATSPIGINCTAVTFSVSNTSNCSSGDHLNSPAPPFPFPGNLFSELFCDTSRTDSGITNYASCSYSGARSMYIPPHMQVTAFGNTIYNTNNGSIGNTNYQGDPWSTYSGSLVYTIQNQTSFTPFTYNMSPYKNGTFPSLAGSTPNSPTAEVYYGYPNSYFSPPIFNCSLTGIWVDVRTDQEFRTSYVTPYYSDNWLLPEIFLIPGITNSPSFLTNMRAAIPVINGLQKIASADAQQFWTTTNPYFTQDGSNETAIIDVTKDVSNTLPLPTTISAIVKIPDFDNKYLRRIKQRFIQPIISLTSVSTVGIRPNGVGRITTFSPINGIMSIEWLYVLYNCAFAFKPGKSSSPSYDQTTKQYVCDTGCSQECMYFRDPYYYNNPTAQGASASDNFMQTHCYMKNLSLAYGAVSNPTANDCACTTTSDFCPKNYSTSCDTAQSASGQCYVPDSTLQQECPPMCSYCQVVNLQLNISDGSISSKENNQIKNVSTCGDASCFGGNGKLPDLSWLLIVIFIIAVIIVGIIGFLVYKKHIQLPKI